MNQPLDEESDSEGRPRAHRPLWVHALALGVLLIAILGVVGTQAVNTDESYVVIQVDALRHGAGWIIPHPFPEVDPTGAAFPVHGATRYATGFTLYEKHPALVYLYMPVHAMLGVAGLVGLSIVGTWLAALLAAMTSERIHRGSGITALWLAGCASPLFFDAFQIHAHTIAAALAALLGLVALRLIEHRKEWWPLFVGVPVAASLVLLRTEGVLFVVAIGGSSFLVGAAIRSVRLVGFAALATVTGAASVLIDRAWGASIVSGGALPFPGLSATTSYLQGRVSSLSFTLLMPGYRGGTVAEVLTLLSAALVVIGTARALRRPDDVHARRLAWLGAVGMGLRSVLQWGPIPGFLVAFCVGVAGMVCMRRALLTQVKTVLLLLTLGLFAVAVAATQYAGGGHTEWGGRYFALGVPIVAALAAASLCHQGVFGPARNRLPDVRMALVVSSAAMLILAVSTLKSAHERSERRVETVMEAAALLPPASDGGAPVVLIDEPQVPRLARGRVNDVRFLRVAIPELGIFLSRLDARGIRDSLIVTESPRSALAAIPDDWQVVGDVTPLELQYTGGAGIIRVRHQPPPNVRS